MFAGCKDASTPVENESSSNLSIMNVEYKSNQTFTLELDLHADGGFSWDHEFSNPNKVRLDSVAYRSKVPSTDGRMLVGGMTVETFYFHTLTSGQCAIKLKEARGWEKDVPPLHVVQLNVTIN